MLVLLGLMHVVDTLVVGLRTHHILLGLDSLAVTRAHLRIHLLLVLVLRVVRLGIGVVRGHIGLVVVRMVLLLVLHLMLRLHEEVLTLVHDEVVGLLGLRLDIHPHWLLVVFVHISWGTFAFGLGTAVVEWGRHLQGVQVLRLLYRVVTVIAFL